MTLLYNSRGIITRRYNDSSIEMSGNEVFLSESLKSKQKTNFNKTNFKIWIDRRMDRQGDGQTGGWTDRRLDRQADGHTGRWTDRQMDIQADGQTGGWTENASQASTFPHVLHAKPLVSAFELFVRYCIIP